MQAKTTEFLNVSLLFSSRYKIQPEDTLTVLNVETEKDAGMFQCFALNDIQSAQDSAQLRLGCEFRCEFMHREFSA